MVPAESPGSGGEFELPAGDPFPHVAVVGLRRGRRDDVQHDHVGLRLDAPTDLPRDDDEIPFRDVAPLLPGDHLPFPGDDVEGDVHVRGVDGNELPGAERGPHNLHLGALEQGRGTIAEAYRKRLKEAAGFKYVPEPIPMRNSKNAVVYYLFFASPNATGARIVAEIFERYRNYGVR